MLSRSEHMPGGEVIGWRIDMQECPTHDGMGLGITVYVLDKHNEVHEAWCCQRADSFDEWVRHLGIE